MAETIDQLVPIFLLNALWQVTVLCAAAMLCAHMMRNLVAPRHQHLLWVAVLVLSVLLPLSSLRVLRDDEQSPTGWSPQVTVQGGAEQTKISTATTAVNSIGLASYLQDQGRTVPYSQPLAWALTGCYLLFVLLRMVKLWLAWHRTNEIRRTAYARFVPALVGSIAKQCQAAYGLKQVDIVCSARITSPVTAGHIRPAVILPEHLFGETSGDMLASVIGHEMAHIRRQDFLLNLLYELLYLPVSFHPAAWLVRRRINETRELACDEMVTERVVEPTAYARSLVQLATSAASFNRSVYMLGVFDACIMEERIMRLTNRKNRASARIGKTLLLVTALVIGATSVAVAAFSFRIKNDTSVMADGMQNSIVGTWQGTWHGDVPAMTLKVKPDGDRLSGTVVFHRAVKTEGGFKVDGKTAELSLIEPRFDGKRLLFKVTPPESKEAIEFEMKLTGDNEAEGWNVSVIQGKTVTVKLKRDKVDLISLPSGGQDKNSAGAAPQSIIVGTWYLHFSAGEGKEAEGPGLTLMLKADGEKLAGTAVSWKEAEPKQGWQKVEWPLIEPKFDGSAFSFKVSNGEEILAAELKLVGEKFEGEWKSSKTMQSGKMKLIKKE